MDLIDTADIAADLRLEREPNRMDGMPVYSCRRHHAPPI